MKIEEALYSKIMQILVDEITTLQQIASALALLDCLVSFATVAKERRYSRPNIRPSGAPLVINDGRHPVVEAISKERFVPNDTLLDNAEHRCLCYSP